MNNQILVVEDEAGVQELLKLNLCMAGYSVDQAFNVDEAIRHLGQTRVDLVLVDWNMPGRSGVSLVRHLRNDQRHKEIPIIMLTARSDEPDKVLAFDSGADDYVTKPFRVRELVARVQSLLRRARRDFRSESIQINGLCIDDEHKRVTVGSHELSLSSTEYRLLLSLAKRPMAIFSRAQLIQQVWGDESDLQERTVDTHVARLRSQMDQAGLPPCIETVRSLGYRLIRLGAEEGVPQHG